MKRGGDRCQVSERRTVGEPAEKGERAAIAHAAQQHVVRIDVPPVAHASQDRIQVLTVDFWFHQRPCAAGRGGCDDDHAARPSLGQPIGEEQAPVAGAAVQREDHRRGFDGIVPGRHVNGKAATLAGLVGGMENARVGVGRFGEALLQHRVVAETGLQQIATYVRDRFGQCRQRLQCSAVLPHRAVGFQHRVGGVRRRSQARAGLQCQRGSEMDLCGRSGLRRHRLRSRFAMTCPGRQVAKSTPAIAAGCIIRAMLPSVSSTASRRVNTPLSYEIVLSMSICSRTTSNVMQTGFSPR